MRPTHRLSSCTAAALCLFPHAQVNPWLLVVRDVPLYGAAAGNEPPENPNSATRAVAACTRHIRFLFGFRFSLFFPELECCARAVASFPPFFSLHIFYLHHTLPRRLKRAMLAKTSITGKNSHKGTKHLSASHATTHTNLVSYVPCSFQSGAQSSLYEEYSRLLLQPGEIAGAHG